MVNHFLDPTIEQQDSKKEKREALSRWWFDWEGFLSTQVLKLWRSFVRMPPLLAWWYETGIIAFMVVCGWHNCPHCGMWLASLPSWWYDTDTIALVVVWHWHHCPHGGMTLTPLPSRWYDTGTIALMVVWHCHHCLHDGINLAPLPSWCYDTGTIASMMV